MASFVQPAFYAPETSKGSAAVSNSRFLIYTNSLAPDLLGTWYQYALLIAGATLLGFTLARPLFWWILSEIAKWREPDEPQLADELADFTRKPKEVALQTSRTFGQYIGGELNSFLQRDYDLHLLDLKTFRSRQFQPHSAPVIHQRRMSTVNRLGSVSASLLRRSSMAPTAGPTMDFRRPSIAPPQTRGSVASGAGSANGDPNRLSTGPFRTPDYRRPSSVAFNTPDYSFRRPSAFGRRPSAAVGMVSMPGDSGRKSSAFGGRRPSTAVSTSPASSAFPGARRPSAAVGMSPSSPGFPDMGRRPSAAVGFKTPEYRRPSMVPGASGVAFRTPEFRRPSMSPSFAQYSMGGNDQGADRNSTPFLSPDYRKPSQLRSPSDARGWSGGGSDGQESERQPAYENRRPSMVPGGMRKMSTTDFRRPSMAARRMSAVRFGGDQTSMAGAGRPMDMRKTSVVAGNFGRRTTFDESAKSANMQLPQNCWVVVDISLWWAAGGDAAEVAQTLKEETEASGIGGLVIDTKDFQGDSLRQACIECLRADLDVMLLDDSDVPTTAPVYALVAGVIFRNAAILSNGTRRDFFAATKLRTALARCKMQLKTRDDFFLGFQDLWSVKPQASVVRRAYKMAKFHKAALHHAPLDSLENSLAPSPSDCLSAFDCMKRSEIIKAQQNWLNASIQRIQSAVRGGSATHLGLGALASDYKLAGLIQPFRQMRKDSGLSAGVMPEEVEQPPFYASSAPPRIDFWTYSSQNQRMCDRGCYDLREEVFQEQYDAIVTTQRHLKKLGLLEPVEAQNASKIADTIFNFMASEAFHKQHLETLVNGIYSKEVLIFKGLDSGFRLPDNQGHFWAISDEIDGVLSIYVSLKAPDVPMAVLHTYLAHYGVPRQARFLLELAIEKLRTGSSKLPARIAKELQSATYSELLSMLQQMHISGVHDNLSVLIRRECERLLIEDPTRISFNQLQCNDLLASTVSIRDVLKARLDLLSRAGVQILPALDRLLEAALEMDNLLQKALYESDEKRLETLAQPLLESFAQPGPLPSPTLDLYALMFFCSLRRFAFEEVYLETTDRCPLFLQQRDQAAVFAEMWALGSQCEIYFGIKPRALGAVIYDRYRIYLEEHPPSTESSKIAEVFTAYQIVEGLDNDNAIVDTGPRTFKQRFALFRQHVANATFLTVFCVPAIVDVCLLTFLGRGLYLTAFMSGEERLMANYAVLSALIMTSGVTGWTGSTGGFYLHTAAFNNMNHFMVQRVSGGFIIAFTFAICGLIAFGLEYSWYAGFIFAAYVLVLSTYLNILGVLTTMHRNNAPFTSGRTVLLTCMLVTLVSPALTTFINGHDIVIYLIVLYVFLAIQIYAWLKLAKSWVSWMDDVQLTNEKEIMAWYEQQPKDEYLTGLPKHLQRSTASSMLTDAIKAYSPKKLSSNADPLVAKLAKGYEFTIFMLKQDDPTSDLPDPYGPTWLTKMKLALENQKALAHGLKEHSPFLLWRRAKYDIGQNVGFFLVVLVDRWVAVSMSANGHVINLYYDVRSRYGIAFGLLYFLVCAVSLDIVLQRYWGKTGRTSASKISNMSEFEKAESEDARLGQKRWLSALYELVSIMLGVFGFTTLLVWLMVYQPRQLILYLAYIVGYSGALIFQFNRVFTTNIRAHVQMVFASAFLGYVVGVLLHTIPGTRDMLYSDIIALNVASLSAAFSTWLFTDFTADAKASPKDIGWDEDDFGWKTYSQKLIGVSEESDVSRVRPPSSMGTEVKFSDDSSLARGIRARFAKAAEQEEDSSTAEAFGDFHEILDQVLVLWEDGNIRLFVMTRKDFVDIGGAHRFAYSKLNGEVLTVLVGLPSAAANGNDDIASQVVAEALLHEACEGAMQMRHAHATLAELLLNEGEPISTRMAVQLAETSRSDLSRIAARTNGEILAHLCLGVNPDITWEQTPESVRAAIVARVSGKEFNMTPVLEQWLFDSADSLLLRQIALRQSIAIRSLALWRLTGGESLNPSAPAFANSSLIPMRLPQTAWQEHLMEDEKTFSDEVINIGKGAYTFVYQLILFTAVITTAGSDAGRELWNSLPENKLRLFFLWPLLKFWKLCTWMKALWMHAIVYSQDADYKNFKHWSNTGGARVLQKGRVEVRDPLNPMTGFFQNSLGRIKVYHYRGAYINRPDKVPHMITTYDEAFRLHRTESAIDGQSAASDGTQMEEKWSYYFDEDPVKAKKRKDMPTVKTRTYRGIELRQYYDDFGRISGGKCVKADDILEFSYTFKPEPKNSQQLLKATYIVSSYESDITWEVYWCNHYEPNDQNLEWWIPCDRLTHLVKTTGTSREEVSWRYDHKRDPIITRASSGYPLQYSDGEMSFIEREAGRMEILTKPNIVCHWDENMLLHHSKRAIRSAITFTEDELDRRPPQKSKSGMFRSGGGIDKGISTVNYALTTATLRAALFKHWTSHPAMPALVVCKIDEMFMRREATLRPYWAFRDAGRFLSAKDYLTDNLDAIIAATEIADDVAQKLILAIKPADLFTMGLSKDSNYIINTPENSFIDTEDRLAVVFTDTGCWPDAPGGVSNCRRDLVDGHKTIRNYALTEGAYDWAVPRFQIERNVQLVQNLPLWGMDGKTPSHGLFDNLLQTEVDQRARATTNRNIKQIFIPILKRIIKGARSLHNSKEDFQELTLCFLRLNEYFETNDYTTTWRSNAVKRAWREAWLHEYNDLNISSLAELFPMERPTRQDFEEALELYIGYFFIFSIRIPEKVPRVYQTTHHGISSLYAMCLKLRRGVCWGIWDHAIMWRESCLNISTAQCFLPIPVQNMLLATMKLAAHLAYIHADIILPCTDTFNPGWEIDLGTDQGCLSSRALMERKIDPITNGIANMDAFTPVERIRTQDPTCVMLSNVQFIKDVKTAIQAAGVIINDFGFTNYNLVVYGAQDRQPSYAVETEELIASLGIGHTVRLGGFGSPKEVLKDAWLFMNSSLSEGLPLAIGEAALSGVPIVATEVGATAQVLTDVDDPSIRYGEVVSPNDPVALARAQISLLAMLGPWAKYTKDDRPPPPLPSKFTADDVEWITARMYEKTEDRRKLGMRLRDVVQRKFNGDRYLREHEQMYWIQRHMAEQRANSQLERLAAAHPKFNQPVHPRFVEFGPPEWIGSRWQDFSLPGKIRFDDIETGSFDSLEKAKGKPYGHVDEGVEMD